MLRVMLFVLAMCVVTVSVSAQDAPDPSRALTHLEPTIAPGNLALLVQPLTQGELLDEIAAWQRLLQQTVTNLNTVRLQLRKINAIRAAEEAGEEPDPAVLIGPAVDVDDQERLAEQAGELLAQRATLLERFLVVIDEYESKGGDGTEFRTYASAVSGVEVDWTDPHSAWRTIRAWGVSEEGGIRLGVRILTFLGVLLAAYVAGAVISWIFAAGFRFSGTGSKLLRRFVVRWSRRLVFFIGALVGLAALGVNVTRWSLPWVPPASSSASPCRTPSATSRAAC
ncbi:MAG: hypothetical protein ACOCYE_03940 [Pseudomonadota bacterium]